MSCEMSHHACLLPKIDAMWPDASDFPARSAANSGGIGAGTRGLFVPAPRGFSAFASMEEKAFYPFFYYPPENF